MTNDLVYDEVNKMFEEEEKEDLQPSYRRNIRAIIRTIYSIQKLRISTGNRVFALFCSRFGMTFEDKNSSKKYKEVFDAIHLSYNRIVDGMNDILSENLKKKKITKKDRTFLLSNLDKILIPVDEVITSLNELILVDQYIDLLQSEEKHFKFLNKILEDIPFYVSYLKKIRGIGPAIAGILISEINIYKSKYSSSIHMYAGLDVAKDGKGRSAKKEHLIKKDYIDRNGETQVKDSLTYNPFLKSKLMKVLADSFIKTGSVTINGIKTNTAYYQIYLDYKNRLQNREDTKDFTKGHIDMMSKRYMIKQFICDLYENWRAFENLPVHQPYPVEKLHRNPHRSPSTT